MAYRRRRYGRSRYTRYMSYGRRRPMRAGRRGMTRRLTRVRRRRVRYGGYARRLVIASPRGILPVKASSYKVRRYRRDRRM